MNNGKQTRIKSGLEIPKVGERHETSDAIEKLDKDPKVFLDAGDHTMGDVAGVHLLHGGKLGELGVQQGLLVGEEHALLRGVDGEDHARDVLACLELGGGIGEDGIGAVDGTAEGGHGGPDLHEQSVLLNPPDLPLDNLANLHITEPEEGVLHNALLQRDNEVAVEGIKPNDPSRVGGPDGELLGGDLLVRLVRDVLGLSGIEGEVKS